MSRHPNFPPKICSKNGYDRCYAGGRWHHLGPTGSAAARLAYDRLVVELSARRAAAPEPPRTLADLTVADVALRFLDHAAATYSDRGGEVPNFRRALAVLVQAHGHTLAARFGEGELEEVMTAMAGKGWCRNVVNRQVRRVRTAWRWAERKKLVPQGSWAGLLALPALPRNSKLARNTPKRQPATWETVQAVLPHCPPAVASMLLLLWWSGCRTQDARILRRCDLDTRGEVWLYYPSLDKNDWRDHADEAPRVVYLGPECQAVLTSWLDAYPRGPEDYLFAPVKRGRCRGCYTAMGLSQSVRRAARLAGVELTPYQIRHSAKDRIAREMGLDAARVFLGHKNLNMTDYYGSVDSKKGVEVASRLG